MQTGCGAESSVDADGARLVVVDFDAHCYGFLGQERFYEFRPLDEAGAAAVEILLGANVVGLPKVLNPVEVEVIDGLSVGVGIFVDDGKGGRCHSVFHSERFADGLDEGGLAGTHLAVEGENASVAHCLHELLCGSGKARSVFYSYLFHHTHVPAIGLWSVSLQLTLPKANCLYRFFPRKVMRGTSISSRLMPPCWKVSL